MERVDLEALDRDTLIGRAEGAGVSRARILTRPELIDELLLRTARAKDPSTLARARGFFGKARDLLARVVERGLHLPDAADRIRSIAPPPAAPPARAAAALPTVTLAEIYATQGHKDRAIETLRRVLEREPDHGAARSLLAQLEDKAYVAPPAPQLPPEEEAAAAPPPRMRDDEPLPSKYDVDECVAIPVDPSTLFVYWEVKDATVGHLLATRPGGTMVLRLVVLLPTWDGPRTQVKDHEVHAQNGDYFVRGLPVGSIVRAAIGWRTESAFLAIAQSPALETPRGAPSPVVADVLVRWTPNGATPVTSDDPDAPTITHALEIARAKLAAAAAPFAGPESGTLPGIGNGVAASGSTAPLGSSERLLEPTA